ncbi:DUF1900-domain-containing protein [Ascodesmis nigricans]|uniref:Coronin n=1 Tax=Ascodesmis nigricans TaxID=341454 RepID=A0A4S2MJY4_9PEZI|nr:DUF1900-domain-containing protein [Ascodesmis nigricans]
MVDTRPTHTDGELGLACGSPDELAAAAETPSGLLRPAASPSNPIPVIIIPSTFFPSSSSPHRPPAISHLALLPSSRLTIPSRERTNDHIFEPQWLADSSDPRNTNAWDSNIIKANPQYLSVNWEAGGGGAFAVIPLSERGRFPELIPLFRGHTAAVLDTDWSPFNDSLIASGSDDGKVFIWTVPENFTLYSDEEEGPKDVAPVMKLTGHTRKVGHVLFHPTAENVLATSSGDYSIKLWDIQTGASNHALKHGDIVQSLSWSTDGNMLVTTCRDKKLRIWDPRQQMAAHEVQGHSGAKNSRAVWMTGSDIGDKIATTGFSKMSDRQLGLWDLRTLTEGPVGDFQMLDSISGVCMPFWDEGTKCLYLAGKGDGNIRYYEYSNDDFIYLSEYKSSDPQRGIAFLPKRGVAVHENEVMRGFKTVADSYIEPISFIVPRRAETFQSDIYPPAPSSEPALSAADWFSGSNAERNMFSLETLYDAESASVQPPPAATTIKPFTPDTPVATAAPFRPPSPTKTTSAPAPRPVSIISDSEGKPKPAAPSTPVEPAKQATPQSSTHKEPPAPRSPVKSSPFVKADHPPAAASSSTTTPHVAATQPPAPTPAATATTPPDLLHHLTKITTLLESQSAQIKTLTEKVETQHKEIMKLSGEVDMLKERLATQVEEKDVVVVGKVAVIGDGGVDIGGKEKEKGERERELEEEGRRKDERIRKLELELEVARS